LDGDFPPVGMYVIFEVDETSFLGGCEKHTEKRSIWFTVCDDKK